MTRTRGEFIPIRDDEGHGHLILEELFFYGHCDGEDLKSVGWRDVDEYAEDYELVLPRSDYTSIQHVYGRKIPSGEKNCWRWMWQRHPGRGAFKVTRLLQRSDVEKRRHRRRYERAIRRRVLRRFPEADIVWIQAYEKTPGAIFHLPEMEWEVRLYTKTGVVEMSREDTDTWDRLYGGRP